MQVCVCVCVLCLLRSEMCHTCDRCLLGQPACLPALPACAGVNQWDSDAPPKYVNNTHLSARVGRLNPDWNQDAGGEPCCRLLLPALLLLPLLLPGLLLLLLGCCWGGASQRGLDTGRGR